MELWRIGGVKCGNRLYGPFKVKNWMMLGLKSRCCHWVQQELEYHVQSGEWGVH